MCLPCYTEWNYLEIPVWDEHSFFFVFVIFHDSKTCPGLMCFCWFFCTTSPFKTESPSLGQRLLLLFSTQANCLKVSKAVSVFIICNRVSCQNFPILIDCINGLYLSNKGVTTVKRAPTEQLQAIFEKVNSFSILSLHCYIITLFLSMHPLIKDQRSWWQLQISFEDFLDCFLKQTMIQLQ